MLNDNDYDIIVKIVLMGNTFVGKTNLMQKFTKGKVNEKQRPTIGMDFLSDEVTLKGNNIKVQYWDTAGQEKYRAITITYYKIADGIILVYDVTNRESFDALEMWMTQIHEQCTSEVQIVLVGNKIDLIEDRQVSQQEGLEFAQKHNCKFFETSAHDDSNGNVKEAFNMVLNDAVDQLKKSMQKEELNQMEGVKRPTQIIYKDQKKSSCC